MFGLQLFDTFATQSELTDDFRPYSLCQSKPIQQKLGQPVVGIAAPFSNCMQACLFNTLMSSSSGQLRPNGGLGGVGTTPKSEPAYHLN
jgi:hypothetical protein